MIFMENPTIFWQLISNFEIANKLDPRDDA
jgi:hypothetical protein